MDGLEWKTILKWMIWGYPYFWKHPYTDTPNTTKVFFHCSLDLDLETQVPVALHRLSRGELPHLGGGKFVKNSAIVTCLGWWVHVTFWKGLSDLQLARHVPELNTAVTLNYCTWCVFFVAWFFCWWLFLCLPSLQKSSKYPREEVLLEDIKAEPQEVFRGPNIFLGGVWMSRVYNIYTYLYVKYLFVLGDPWTTENDRLSPNKARGC